MVHPQGIGSGVSTASRRHGSAANHITAATETAALRGRCAAAGGREIAAGSAGVIAAGPAVAVHGAGTAVDVLGHVSVLELPLAAGALHPLPGAIPLHVRSARVVNEGELQQGAEHKTLAHLEIYWGGSVDLLW